MVEIKSYDKRQQWKKYFAKDKSRYLAYGFLRLYEQFDKAQLNHYYVYEEDNIVKALLRYAINDKRVLIEELAVDPFFENDQIIDKLYLSFEKIAMQNQMIELYIWVMMKDDCLIANLLSWGFKEESVKRYYEDSMYLQQRYRKNIVKGKDV
ncbi:MAG: hypothetical protein SPH32_07905 [Erysipelotrichaceae bacterium]|nr:hypothetical protein [Erysipelotrichaceae bacterium]